jgi:hypothetical protein
MGLINITNRPTRASVADQGVRPTGIPYCFSCTVKSSAAISLTFLK